MTGTGSPSITTADLSLRVSGLPMNVTGLYFAGSLAAAGGAGVPIGNGLRCVGGDITRIAKVPATQDGTSELPGRGLPPIHQLIGATAGTTTYFQYWYRDSGGPCGANANMTNGLRVTRGI